jgi:cysteine-rich repeat protein
VPHQVAAHELAKGTGVTFAGPSAPAHIVRLGNNPGTKIGAAGSLEGEPADFPANEGGFIVIRTWTLASVVAALLAGVSGPALGAPVISADEVCAADADPCEVTSPISIADRAVLDFFNRTVNVSGDGLFDVGSGHGTILCGSFNAATSGNALVAAAPGEEDGGSLSIRARRLCTAGSPQRPCFNLEDCQLGSCSATRCSQSPATTCGTDADCMLGPCRSIGVCDGAHSLRCQTDADCSGVCDAQLTCAGGDDAPRDCAQDADCDLGTCAVGEASISMAGRIYGVAQYPADIELFAADSVTITAPVELSSDNIEGDGGDLTVIAWSGSIGVHEPIHATSGGFANGGYVELYAEQDVSITAPIDIRGGDFDGGVLYVNAARDIAVTSSVFAQSGSGAGYGGEISLYAGRDLNVGGGSRAIRLNVNGHKSYDNFGGDGGLLEFQAGRNAVFARNTRMLAVGSEANTIAGSVWFVVGGDLSLAGQIRARSRGARGGGGELDINGTGLVSVADGATIDLRGGETASSVARINSSAGAVTIAGRILMGGTSQPTNDGILEIDACRVAISGNLVNKSSAATSTVTVHESMTLLAGGQLQTPDGTNEFIYRASAKPPLVSGKVSPTASLVLDALLTGCPVCGNAEIDFGETCDDGNVAGGDGCGSNCLLE